jgi:hypothetical protein
MATETPTMQEKTVRLPNFAQDQIGLIIGPNKVSCQKNQRLNKLPSLRKNVISKAWQNYNLHKEEAKLECDDPKTPYIQISHDDEGVFAVIKSDSEIMMKFALFHLSKYHTEFVAPKKKMFYNLYTTMDHSSIPRLIGRGAATIKSIRTEAVSQMDESVDVDDLSLCEKSFVKVDKCIPRDMTDFKEMISKNDRASFVGWPPEDGEEIVKVSVSSTASKEAFDGFIECITDVIDSHVKDINESSARFSQNKAQELSNIQEALNSDW